MQKLKIFGMAFVFAGSLAVCVAQAAVSAVKGTVKKVDASTNTIVIETRDGADRTFHYVGRTIVRDGKATDQTAVHDVDKIGEGAKVVAHYTTADGKDTVSEIDRLGEDGLKTSTGTIDELDRVGKKLVLKADDGTQTTFRLSDNAVVDAGKDIEKDSEKSAHVVVYYTEESGKKVALFFETSV